MEENQITGMIVDRSLHIHKELGPGLLESVYQRILTYELRKAGLTVETEVPIPVKWDGHVIDESFRADLIINQKVLVELKSIEGTNPVHRKQTLTYLKLSKLSVGLLINFGSAVLRNDIHRLVNDFHQ
ncbi:MAG: GxxExxY protein [Verrucomicrobiota bacterium]